MVTSTCWMEFSERSKNLLDRPRESHNHAGKRELHKQFVIEISIHNSVDQY